MLMPSTNIPPSPGGRGLGGGGAELLHVVLLKNGPKSQMMQGLFIYEYDTIKLLQQPKCVKACLYFSLLT